MTAEVNLREGMRLGTERPHNRYATLTPPGLSYNESHATMNICSKNSVELTCWHRL